MKKTEPSDDGMPLQVKKFGMPKVHSVQSLLWHFLRDGRFLAIGDKIGKIRLFDFDADPNERESRIFTSHTRKITALMFSKNSDTLVSGSEDGTVILWEINRVLDQAE